jgi:hypothetical protein
MITLSHTSLFTAVTATSAQLTLDAGERYMISCDVACWIRQGADPTAEAATPANTYLPANFPVVISAGAGNVKVAAIRAVGDGNLTATRLL